jgi:hypothetical protein
MGRRALTFNALPDPLETLVAEPTTGKRTSGLG